MPRWLAMLLLTLATAAGSAHASELAGRIWAPDQDRFVAPAEVERAIANARFVLLGEEHSIAAHHALQARLLRVAARQSRPAVIFEMIPAPRQSAIDAWRRAPNPTAAELGPAVAWSERGWPDWNIYLPIVEVALERDLPLVAGAPADSRLRSVAGAGLESLTAERQRALRLDRALPEAGHERLLATLRGVHCGQSHAATTRMLAIQRLRDATMAEHL
ncbi:MAG: ChaN family lipoprotein, partial [Halofilum sp. (in: g-proteobacteria)]